MNMRVTPKEILEVVEQRAIYDGRLRLCVPAAALMYLLNHCALEGGTIRDRNALIASGEAPDAKLFNVRIVIEAEEVIEDHTSPSA